MTHTFLNIFTRPLEPLYQFLYPPLCAVCHSQLPHRDSRVCSDCWLGMTAVSTDMPLFRQALHRLCEEGSSEVLVSSFVFEEQTPIHDIIHQLKYRENTALGIELGKKVGQLVQGEIRVSPLAGIIPVPLHRTKKRERGYNQSEVIARGISALLHIPVFAGILRRTRYTESQTRLSARERKSNVHGAFSMRPKMIPVVTRKRYLLVDDVITTGATIEECAMVLCDSGALPPVVCSAALAE